MLSRLFMSMCEIPLQPYPQVTPETEGDLAENWRFYKSNLECGIKM